MPEASIIEFEGFDAEEDAKTLRAAMKGLGTDEDKVMEVICARNNEQLQDVKNKYSQAFGRVLLDDLKSELGGKLEKIIIGRFATQGQLDAYLLHAAIDGMGTDETGLIEIMCTRNNEEMSNIKECYKKKYNKELMKDLVGDTSGDFKRFLVSMDAADRTEDDDTDGDKAEKEAEELYNAGENMTGTDEETWNRILACRSRAQLRRTFEVYQDRFNQKHGIIGAIKSEFSGSIKECYLAVATTVLCGREAYYADKLYQSMDGAGTDDDQLMRMILTRAEVDLKTVGYRFEERYGKSLAHMIEGDTSGDYKKSLLRIVAGNY